MTVEIGTDVGAACDIQDGCTRIGGRPLWMGTAVRITGKGAGSNGSVKGIESELKIVARHCSREVEVAGLAVLADIGIKHMGVMGTGGTKTKRTLSRSRQTLVITDDVVDRWIAVTHVAAAVNFAIDMQSLVFEAHAIICQIRVAILAGSQCLPVMDIAGIGSRRWHGVTFDAVRSTVAGQIGYIPRRILPLDAAGNSCIWSG